MAGESYAGPTIKIALGEELAEVKEVSPRQLKPWRFGTGYAVSDWLKSLNYD
jgi:hypothetical protein